MFRKCFPALFAALLQLAAASAQNPIHEIKGTVVLDQNANCIADAADVPLENWFLRVEASGEVFSVETDANGFYRFFVPDGFYALNLKLLNEQFDFCASASQSVNFNSGTPQSATFDFVVKSVFSCPRLRTELSASNVQPCSTATVRAFYRNDGTTTSANTTLTVRLDPLLTYQNATPVPTSVLSGGQELVFALGNLPPAPGGAWRSIEIQAKVACAARAGAQVGASVEATPSLYCGTAPSWSGAIIVASGICAGNTDAQFALENIGNAPSSQLEFTIVEDIIVLRQGTFQLNPGGQINLDTIVGSGQPITLYAQQEPGFPGDSLVVFTVFNCGPPNTQGTGYGGSPGPFRWSEGFQVLDHPESNEKNALPPGVGAQRKLRLGPPVEYRLHFQNTGTSIVNSLTLRDTLDLDFDFEKIEPRGSSHAYDFSKIADNVVQFTFSNLQLPPAASNPNGSNGFVEFLVYPKPHLLPGTQVHNRASYRFDMQTPLPTHTVVRTYDTSLVVKVLDLQGFENGGVRVFPNPFRWETTFELPENAPPGDYRLDVFDGLGRLAQTAYFVGGRCLLRRDGLSNGHLFWRISRAGRTMAGGSLVLSTD